MLFVENSYLVNYIRGALVPTKNFIPSFGGWILNFWCSTEIPQNH